MPYAEFPADEIVDCHFKKKDDGGGGPGGGGLHLCGEWGYNFPGDGFYVIYYDSPPPPHRRTEIVRIIPRFIPYSPPPIILPSSSPVPAPQESTGWIPAQTLYLLSTGIYHNPYGQASIDLAMGYTPLEVAASFYEITWDIALEADPYLGEGTYMPYFCNHLQGYGYGFAIRNRETDPAFNVFSIENAPPNSPNYGTAPGTVTYDYQKSGDCIFWNMGWVDIVSDCEERMANSECGPGGCYANTWSADAHFNIKAYCGG